MTFPRGWNALLVAAFLLTSAVCRRREAPRAPPPTPTGGGVEFVAFAVGSRPQGIAAGRDGGIWFTEEGSNRIGRLGAEPPHGFEEFPLPRADSEPWGIVVGPDGNLWFTESNGNRVGFISPRPPHAISEFEVPASRSWPRSIVAGADGNVWFGEAGASRIGRVRVAPPHEIEEFPLPRRPSTVAAITAGPDGNIWFGATGEVVGRALAIFPEAMLEFSLRVKNGTPSVMAAASEGSVWFGQERTGTIGRILTAQPYAVTELQIPGPLRPAVGLCATPGYLWLTQRGHRAILRIEAAPPHRIREIAVPETVGIPGALAEGPDGNIWFTVPDGNGIGRLRIRSVDETAGRTGAATDAPAKVVAQYEPKEAKPEGDLEVRSDFDCTIFLDGVEMFRLAAGGGRVLPVSVGKHLVTALLRSEERLERSVEVFSGLRAHAIFEKLGGSAASAVPSPSFPQGGGGRDPGIAFVRIAEGEFVMGVDGGRPDERPAHRVRITRPFEMARYELTQREWQAVMGSFTMDQSTPEWSVQRPRIRYGDLGADKPVVGVSWEDAQEFVAALNRIDGRGRYRLPSEAEWEYACRAGSVEEAPADLGPFAWARQENLWPELHPVGKKRPNGWGLYDMHGNAAEWVADWYDKDYYRRTPASDPTGAPSGATRVFRGGSFWSLASNCGCAYRHGGGGLPVGRERATGIRLVRENR